MDRIVRFHEKVLDFLLRRRQSDPSLYFVPRKKNNKSRLEKGYWFLGNSEYLTFSLWDGNDGLQKIPNIGFVVLKDRTSYVELSAQDDNATGSFLNKLAAKIGAKRRGLENKWFKVYKDTRFLDNLDQFITHDKPVIDAFILSEKPAHIKPLNDVSFKKYADRAIGHRLEQIKYGSINKIARITWNTHGWKYPSGSQGKPTNGDFFEVTHGYGHEEWLFDKRRLFKGYHYAFLQQLHIDSDKHVGRLYNIDLYTINNLDKRYYVGQIKDVECISKNDSIDAFEYYRSKGWYDEMRKELENVGADTSVFQKFDARKFFNIRFKLENAPTIDDLPEIASDDLNITTTRFKLLPKKDDFVFVEEQIVADEDEGKDRSTTRRKKIFDGECEYDPNHDIMQNKVRQLLRESGEYAFVGIEKSRVDLKARKNDGTWHFFELKTDSARISIRKALGQIMEYAYFPSEVKADKLFIISDGKPDPTISSYMNHIRDKFKLPIVYRHYDWDKNSLSPEY